ncbi:MAG TPA: rhomboid family intramembrane serine protease [Polyangiaceae bacterium]|nr:rhomboid family intramembrane serine protease [Polyangiaceae bacterium]
MIPIGDENPTLRTPVVTYLLLATLLAVWILVQGGGFEPHTLAATICNLGLVPGELTGKAAVGTGVPIGPGMACVVDREPINWLTPLFSMFLHGSWGHLLGNGLFLWVFGNNVEDSMGRGRFLGFYLLCGLVAAATQIAVGPSSAVPMVGASGAISGVLGGYLLLYPKVRVRVLFILFIFIRVFRIPAYLVLLWWIGYQLVLGLPELMAVDPEVSSGVAFWAHIGGFVAGLLLVKLFARDDLIRRHRAQRAFRSFAT